MKVVRVTAELTLVRLPLTPLNRPEQISRRLIHCSSQPEDGAECRMRSAEMVVRLVDVVDFKLYFIFSAPLAYFAKSTADC